LVNKIWIRDIPMSGGTVQVPFTPDGTKIFAANGSRCTIIDVNRAANPANWPNPLDAIDASIPTGRGAHGVAFGGKAGGGLYAYVSHKFENYVSVIDVSSQTHVGDIPLTLSTTGKLSLAGCTDTGGNGISVRPSPVPWK
jgi:DNA-binding beta-propeller fold protein YncE